MFTYEELKAIGWLMLAGAVIVILILAWEK